MVKKKNVSFVNHLSHVVIDSLMEFKKNNRRSVVLEWNSTVEYLHIAAYVVFYSLFDI